jgi:hypothetical protein
VPQRVANDSLKAAPNRNLAPRSFLTIFTAEGSTGLAGCSSRQAQGFNIPEIGRQEYGQ